MENKTNLENNSNSLSNSEEVTLTENKKINYIWAIPLIALAITLYLLVSHISNRGKLISINFQNAEGLEIGKTKLKFKDVDIGLVEDIQIIKEDNVLIKVRVKKTAVKFIKSDAKFWIVKPRLELTKISGLGTLVSGAYITVKPGKSEDFETNFDGLDLPPIVTTDKKGLRLTLLAEKSTTISAGTRIYYRGIEVGIVERKYLSKDFLWVKIDIFVSAPNDSLISSNTRFWSTTGVSVSTSGSGISFEIDSINQVIAGGISFETPIEDNNYTVKNNSEFVLFESKNKARNHIFGKKAHFVTFFEGNVGGLTKGSDVSIQGISIGKVKNVELTYNTLRNKTVVKATLEIYNSKIDKNNLHVLENITERGVITQLETSNLLTGTKQISLLLNKGFYHAKDGEDNENEIDESTGYVVIPSKSDNLSEITSGVSGLITKVNQLPLSETLDNVNKLLTSVDGLVKGVDVEPTLKSFNQLLKNAESLPKGLKKTLSNLDRNFRTITKSIDGTLSGFAPDAPIYHNLNKTLKELNKTLKSFKTLSDTLNRSPDALIFGEKRK